MNSTRVAIAAALTFLAVAYLLTSFPAGAAPQPAYSASTVTHVEHLGVRVETHPGHCLRTDWTTAKDAGAFLSGEPDAAFMFPFDGPDAAIFYNGANDASWVPPDAGVMGPRVLPKTGVSYQCTARNNNACWRQGTAPDTCTYTAFLPADQPTAPFAFSPEPDGGQPKVFGIGSGGTSSVSCCPIYPAVMSGN